MNLFVETNTFCAFYYEMRFSVNEWSKCGIFYDIDLNEWAKGHFEWIKRLTICVCESNKKRSEDNGKKINKKTN